MKKIFLLGLIAAIIFTSCKKKDEAPAPSEISCDEALEIDAITDDSTSGDSFYFTGKNFFCLQDTLKVLVTLKNECTNKDSQVVVTLLKKDYTNPSELTFLNFNMPKETGGQIGVSKVYFKIVHGGDTMDLTGNTPLQIYDVFFNNQKYVTLGDSIVIRPANSSINGIKKITVNGTTTPFRAVNTVNGYEYRAAVPSGLTEGNLTLRAFSSCDKELKAYLSASYPKIQYISKSHWFMVSQPRETGGDDPKYFFDVTFNKSETTSGTIVIKFKNKETLEEETLPLSGYGYGNNQRGYTFYKPLNFKGTYTISVKKGTTVYECADASADVVFP